MINNSKQRIFSSKYAPDPKLNVLWMDLTADPDGAIIKYYDSETGIYLPLSGDGGGPGAPGQDGSDGRSPYIGQNGNWYIFSDEYQTYQDSGIKASGSAGAVFTPSISESGVLSWTNTGGLQNPSPSSIKGIDGKSAFQSAVDGGYEGTESEFNAKLAASTETINTSEGTAIGVGYIPAGTNLNGKTVMDVIDQMLYKELFPSFTAPSSTFTTGTSTLQKVGSTINISFLTSFSRGSISPAYGTDGYRSGIPTKYEYTGTGLNTITDASANLLSNSQTVSSYTILLGANTWTSKVYYSEGTRPLSSRGLEYNELALPAGSVSTRTITITGVYPVMATTVDTNTLTEQSLLSHGSDIIVSFAKEDTFNSVLKKQVIKIPKAWKSGDAFLTQAYQRDEQTGLYGSTNIMSSFTQTAGTGDDSLYNIYTHNGGQIGSRTIKFKV